MKILFHNHPGPESVYVLCDVCKGKFRRKDTILVSDKWNLQNGLVVCRADLDKINPQILPVRPREDKIVTNPKHLRSEPADRFATNELDNRVPSAPRLPTATSGIIDPTQIELKWQAPYDAGSSDIGGYLIERSHPQDAVYEVLSNNTQTGTTYYLDETPDITNDYSYRVAAINGFGTGAYSPIFYWPHRSSDTELTYLIDENGNLIEDENGYFIVDG